MPIILTVNERNYEETLDWNLHKLLPLDQRIEKTNAYPVTKPRIIGDIGLRGFFQLREKALQLIEQEGIDFVYILIPSFYVALLGPYLKRKTGIKYGIDYIDPWVHHFPGSEIAFSRHWWSTKLAAWLEPKAVRSASLITGVAEGYYEGVKKRNPQLIKQCVFGAMPYGGEKKDHEIVESQNAKPYLFTKNRKLQLVYAGAMLPKAFGPLEAIFKSITGNRNLFEEIEFHFIGTGKTPSDVKGFNIKLLAEKYGLWQSVVFEYPQRIPYLDVLVHLNAADAVFILGSTEPHYTPSKTYQAVLSAKPILAVLHDQSTAVNVIRNTKAGVVLAFEGEFGINFIEDGFASFFQSFMSFQEQFEPSHVDMKAFDRFSAKEVTKQLAILLKKVLQPC